MYADRGRPCICRWATMALLALAVVAPATAQAVPAPAPGAVPGAAAPSPWALWFRGQAQTNGDGQTYLLDSSLAYRLSPRWIVMAGIPYYSFHPTGGGSRNGFGDAYLALDANTRFASTFLTARLAGTVPTGSRSAGLSTDHVTASAFARVSRAFGRVAPFGTLGITSSILNQGDFIRPVTSYGWAIQAQAGLELFPIPRWGAGAAFYGIFPIGTQDVFPRGGMRGRASLRMGLPPVPAQSGGAALDRDHGVSAWVDVNPIPDFVIEAAYTRSQLYALNTASLNVGFNVLSLF